MKFAEHLSAHITPEWRKQYIQYEAMKDMLYEAVEEAPSPETTGPDIITRHFAQFDETFFLYCDKELLKINTFFSEKIAEATRKIASLKADLDASEDAHLHTSVRRRRTSLKILKIDRTQTHVKKMHDVKLAFSEFYLSLILLQNYQTLNFTGFRKILKKHDKLLQTDSGARWRQTFVDVALFYTSKGVDQLIKETEAVFTQRLEGGDRQKAMKRLRVPPLGEKQNMWTTFRVGLFSGLFVILITVGVMAAVYVDGGHKLHWQPALRMYRGTFLVILCIFLLGINTYGWRSSGVNHVLIFELDPRDHLTHQQLLEVAGFFAVIWAISIVSFVFSKYIHVPGFANPLCLVAFFFLYLVNPIRILHFKARRWLRRVLFRIVTAPFHHVGFADFWLADQLNSLTTVLLDFEYLVCYFAMEVEWLGADRLNWDQNWPSRPATSRTYWPEDDFTSPSELNMNFSSVAQDTLKLFIVPNISPVVCGKVSTGIRPVVACLPAWFRFAQCLRRYRDTRLVFPHIVNAGKYSTTFFVVLFSSLNAGYTEKHDDAVQRNVFFYLWIIAALVSTCYTFTWDVKMDWGLFDKNAAENRFLREEVVYAYNGYYYFAIVEDFILRFAWTITVSVGQAEFIHADILTSILASLEVFRRFIWNFYRLENEHLNNCGQFRAVRDISIMPIDADDRPLLEEMMDSFDGVSNRKRQKQKSLNRITITEAEDTTILIEQDQGGDS